MDPSDLIDTSPDAERVQIRILRAMPAWKRLRLVDELCAATTRLALADLKQAHPAASADELSALLAERVRLAWRLDPPAECSSAPDDAALVELPRAGD